MKIIDLVNNEPSRFLYNLLKDVWLKPNSEMFFDYYDPDVKLHFQNHILGVEAIRNRINNFLKYNRTEIIIQDALLIDNILISHGKHIGFDKKTEKYFVIHAGIVYRLKNNKIIEIWVLDNMSKSYESVYYDGNYRASEKNIASQFIQTIVSHNLTKRELECLSLVLDGKTAKEIAKDLQISFRTAETYIERLKLKLNCENKNTIKDKLTPIGLWK